MSKSQIEDYGDRSYSSQFYKNDHKKSRNVHNNEHYLMNLYPVELEPKRLLEYNWSISPNLDNAPLKRDILEVAMAELDAGPFIIDSKKVILTKPLKILKTGVSWDNIQYSLTFKLRKDNGDSYRRRTSSSFSSDKKNTLILNGILENIGLTNMGREYYNINQKLQHIKKPQRTRYSENNLELDKILNGFQLENSDFRLIKGISAKIHSRNFDKKKNNNNNKEDRQKNSYLEIDLLTKSISEKNILEWILERKSKLNNKNRASNRDWKKIINDQIKGSRVITEYNGRKYILNRVTWDKDIQYRFIWNKQDENGKKIEKEISIYDYYRLTYGLNIKNREQPLLEVIIPKNENRVIYLVPEFCKFVGLNEKIIDNPKLRNEITKNSQIEPETSKEKIHELLELGSFKENSKNWGFKIDSKMISVEGKKIEKNRISIRSNIINEDHQNNYKNWWMSNLNRTKLDYELAPSIQEKNQTWLILYDVKCARRNIIESKIDFIRKIAKEIGFKDFRFELINFKYTYEIKQKIKNNSIFKSNKSRIQCVLTISYSKSKNYYKELKQIIEKELELPSQNVLWKNLNRKKSSAVIRNLLRQIVCKIKDSNNIGNTLWKVEDSKIPKNSMIAGLDIWHGGNGNSVAGLVLSIDRGIHSRSIPIFQDRRYQEIVPKIGKEIKNFIKENENKGKIIDRILFFRDGVGSSQYIEIITKEIKELKDELFKARNYNEISKIPKIAMILINKRIHRKFYLNSGENKISNPSPGTYVVDPLSLEEASQYYLVCHETRAGTVKPIHFSIIYNDTELSDEKLIEIGYELSHLYYNWPGTIRLPAPVQYAHLLAEHHGSLGIKKPIEKLKDTYYYI